MSQAEETHYWLQQADKRLFQFAKGHWPAWVCDRLTIAELAARAKLSRAHYYRMRLEVRTYIDRARHEYSHVA